MAAGKSSVGRALAAATGRPFVDVDEAIPDLATLVATDEPAFRRREAAEIARLFTPAAGDQVIATGGGAAAHGDNLAVMKAAGLVVALGVDVEEAQRRAVAQGTVRPLLGHAGALAAARAAVYRRAHAVIDTMGKSIEAVVREVRDVERVWSAVPASERGSATILALGDRSYPVTVSEQLPATLLRAQLRGATRVALLTDENVAPYHLAATVAALGMPVEVLTIPAGEASKSFAMYERLCGELVARGLDRGATLVALGGGVVGDLAGFVAATLYRGIAVIQLPTTIVAMTDAAIGGKTAIDTPAGKNLVGAFWQPRLVACATGTLATLPARERRAGFGELWKYALLDGPDLWRAVSACAPWAAAGEGAPPPAALRAVIDRAIAYKAAIVARDEREQSGHRALLNLGHTVGHAIEAATGLLHGEAVALGLVAACRVSAAVVGTRPALATEVAEALAASGLPHEPAPYLTDVILDRLAVDKKRHGSAVRFIAVREVGACEPVAIEVTDLRRILRPAAGG